MIVVDTNVLAYAVRPGANTNAALQAKRKDPDWVAPAFWRLELSNVLALSMRVQHLEIADAIEAFTTAESLVRDAETGSQNVEALLALAAEGQISAYDAEFVRTAQVLGVSLVTSDRRLARAFPGVAQLLEDFSAAV